MSAPTGDAPEVPGRRIILASDVGTAVFTLATVAGAVFYDAFQGVFVAVSLGLFLAGCVVFLVAFFRAVERSRTSEIGMGGLFFLAGSAPRAVQVRLLGAFGVQVVVALAGAFARLPNDSRPFSTMAFGVLVPMYGLGLAGLWGATYGTFGPRRGDPGAPAGEGAEPSGRGSAGGGEADAGVDDGDPAA